MMTLGILCGGGKFVLQYMGTVGYVSGTKIEGSVNIGAAAGDREIFMVVSTINTTSPPTLVAATSKTNGVSVVKATHEFSAAIGSINAKHSQSCAFATVPSGDGAVTCTAQFTGGTPFGGAMSIYRVTGRPGIGSNQTAGLTTVKTVAGSMTRAALVTNAGGMFLGACLAGAAGTITCSTGVTVDSHIQNGTYNSPIHHHSRLVPDAGATRTESFSKTGNDTDWTCAGWSFA